ncbi:MAG: hypothetical protein VCA57_04640 [Pseudomonas sp.]
MASKLAYGMAWKSIDIIASAPGAFHRTDTKNTLPARRFQKKLR